MHGLWSIALQYTIEYTLCEPSIVIKKGIFRLCSLETKNSRGSTLFQDSKSCPQARNVRNSYSAHAVGFAESAPGCTFCTDLRGLLSANGIPSLAPSICILFPFHAFSNLFISAISQMLRLWQFATSRSICTTIIRIKNFLLFVKGCRCFCSACAE